MPVAIPSPAPSQRVLLVDALRGFGLLGILVLHSLEHFQLQGRGTDIIGPFSAETDRAVMQACSFLFQSKSYAIFCLMFGFSFWVQYQSRLRQGGDFTPRFLWRMAILLGFGFLHGLIYSADLLAIYALLSVVLVFTRKWPDWLLVILAAVLLLQPFYMARLVFTLNHPEADLFPFPPGGYWKPLQPILQQDSIWELMKGNLTHGWKAILTWAWEHGRYPQTTGLFILGMVAARRNVFTQASPRFWVMVLVISLLLFIPLNEARENLRVWTTEAGTFRRQFRLILEAWRNLAQSFMWVALFALAWRSKYMNPALRLLAPLGKMSLTHYVAMSVAGVFVFQGVGLGLHRYLGTTMTLFYAVVALSCHLIFSHFWLGRFAHGPLECLWKRFTWIGAGEEAPGRGQ